MLEESGEFLSTKKEMSISVPITNQIDQLSIEEKISDNTEMTDFKISTKIISDLTKNEIISATKVAVFNQCPFKYYLIYELGYSALNSKMNNKDLPVDYSNEDVEELSANVKGSIIHKILEEDTSLDQLKTRISELINSFAQSSYSEKKDETINSVYNSVEKYYSSGIYQKLKSHKNFHNEFEIYTKLNDYFIYGIIDKVIFDGDNIFIYDYKTDSLAKSSSEEKLVSYKPQLTFYALLLSKLFAEIDKFSCSLILIDDPTKVASFSTSRKELEKFERKLDDIVYSMRIGSFKKDTSHCRSCYFSNSKNECVVQH